MSSMYVLIDNFFSYKIHFNKWKNLEIQILPCKKLKEDVIKKFFFYIEKTFLGKVNMSTNIS